MQIGSASTFQQNNLGNVDMQGQPYYAAPGSQPSMQPAPVQQVPMQVDQQQP